MECRFCVPRLPTHQLDWAKREIHFSTQNHHEWMFSIKKVASDIVDLVFSSALLVTLLHAVSYSSAYLMFMSKVLKMIRPSNEFKMNVTVLVGWKWEFVWPSCYVHTISALVQWNSDQKPRRNRVEDDQDSFVLFCFFLLYAVASINSIASIFIVCLSCASVGRTANKATQLISLYSLSLFLS